VSDIQEIFDALLQHYGKQHWWPADTCFEVIVGGILTQQVAWANVEKAINNMKRAGMLSIDAIADADIEKLQQCIRPSGYFRQKAGRLQWVCRYLRDQWDGDLDAFFVRDAGEVRDELLSWKGIGKETADSILCYAGDKLLFVVDAYTKRLCERLPVTGIAHLDYDCVQDFFQMELPRDLYVYQEFHALIVRLCKDCCRGNITRLRCGQCPLQDDCSFFLDGLDATEL
jgi:endonuclease-3 related protein